jgi:glucose dehydrogenase
MATHELSRRQFVAAASVGGMSLAALLAARTAAQDATPAAATPAAQSATLTTNSAGPTAVPLGPAIPPEATSSDTNWAVESHDLQATRNVGASTISTKNVGSLSMAWNLPSDISGMFGALTSNPVIVDDTLYFQDAKSNVKAVNRATGEVVWSKKYDQDVPSGGPNGVAIGYGMAIFPVGGKGDVYAVDAATGKDAWQANIQGPRNEGITMAPIIYDSTVYISTIPGNVDAFYVGGQRGVLHALDVSTGRVLWYFDTVVDNLWGNARINSGGGLWHPPSFDADGNLYVGIGNAAPYPGNKEAPAGSSRPGDNDYACSLLRINPATGGVDWYINIKPHDLFDLDNQLTPVVADVTIDGTDTPLVFASGKHGLVVAVNRETGQEVWRTPVGKHENDDLTELPTDKTVMVYPGTFGGVETPLAYADGVIYAPVFNLGSGYTATGLDPSSLDISTATGELVALDAATGDIMWDIELPTGTLAGATVVNDLVFIGGLDGLVRAHNITDGSQVWAFQTGAGINAPLAVSGDYLYVASGGPLIPSDDTQDAKPVDGAALIAISLSSGATPEASPAS